MIIRGYEWGLLRELIGKKAEAVIIPTSSNSISDPVEAILVLGDKQGLLIDSCFRQQRPTETVHNYPQMRVRMIEQIPDYSKSQRIDLNNEGEIIRKVEVVNEEFSSPSDFVDYTKAIHIEFSGDKDITITRESFRNPSLRVSEKSNWQEAVEKPTPYVTRQILTL